MSANLIFRALLALVPGYLSCHHVPFGLCRVMLPCLHLVPCSLALGMAALPALPPPSHNQTLLDHLSPNIPQSCSVFADEFYL